MMRAGGWIVAGQVVPAPAVRMFCLPYAGGGASIYARWHGLFGADVEVCPVELPGRQTRFKDEPFTAMGPLVDALAPALAGELDRPYVLFGHSMGSLVCFELARAFRRAGLRAPALLVASGGPAPHLPRLSPDIHDKPNEAVVAKMVSLGGPGIELAEVPELVELLLPTIRADFTVVETYRCAQRPPLDCPIVAVGGAEDAEVPPTRVAPWREHTTGEFQHHTLPGDHFFPWPSPQPLVEVIRSAVRGGAARSAR